MNAFEIKVNGKILDYRASKQLDLDKLAIFFAKKYKLLKLWSGGRHILGILEKNNEKLFHNKKFFLKLATTEGISAVTKIEYKWNEQFNNLVPRQNSRFWVPRNEESGLYKDKLFFFVTDSFDGELLAEKPKKVAISNNFLNSLPSIIEFSELIQKLNISDLSILEDSNYIELFLNKTKAWYSDIPNDIKDKYKIYDLLKIVEEEASNLQKKVRHGDFTPWHLIKLKKGQIELIDGEHARVNGVEYYDIGYFIQRVFSVLENPELAQKILSLLLNRGYNLEKLTTILAARGIGGFLDESFKSHPNYNLSNRFKDWVVNQ